MHASRNGSIVRVATTPLRFLSPGSSTCSQCSVWSRTHIRPCDQGSDPACADAVDANPGREWTAREQTGWAVALDPVLLFGTW